MERQLIAQIKKDPIYPFVNRVLQKDNPQKRKSIPVKVIIDNIRPDQNNSVEYKKQKRLESPLEDKEIKNQKEFDETFDEILLSLTKLVNKKNNI